MKRLLALVAGGLGLRAFLKRRSRPAVSPSPAEDLRAKLAQTKAQEPEPAEPEAAQPETVEGRRADVHAKARQAIDDLGKS
jgi:hypothetical protein